MGKRINVLLVLAWSWIGCEKYLEKKSNQKLVVPTRVANLQTLLDDKSLLNEKEPNAGVVASDDYILPTANWQSLSEAPRNMHVWASGNVYAPGSGNNWVLLYNQIYNANVVLDNIDEATDRETNVAEWRNVKGQALFLRARCYAALLQIFAMPYDPLRSGADLGVPIRIDINFNVASVRGSVEDGYRRVLGDLRLAADLLPREPLHPIRPAKAATFGMLARTYLSMNLVDSCLFFTDRALEIKSNLMDYNGDVGLNATANYPFIRANPEVVYDTYMPTPSPLSNGLILPELYQSYHSDDLRKTLFHRTATTVGNFKGTYSGGSHLFNGIATDELYLMKAECLARKGEINKGVEVLNELLIKRFRTGTFVPYLATTQEQVLELILTERRKELVFRGLRWSDVRRLNKIGANIILRRMLDREYLLMPNDLRYAMAIPEDIVSTAGIPQNPR